MKRVLGLAAVALLAACHSSSSLDSADEAAAAAPGTGKCDPTRPGAVLDKLLNAPIVPAHLFDTSTAAVASQTWSGLSLDKMEYEYCASDPTTEDEATVTAGWGGIAPNYAVTVQYRKTDHQIQFFQLNPGYMGKLEFASRPTAIDDPSKPNPFGTHTYSISLGVPVQRDGKEWDLDWTNFDQQATELYDALMFTFAPELKSTQTSCRTDGSCLTHGADGQGVFGVRPLGIYFTVPKMDAQPAASTPAYFYGFPLRTTPFSNADVMLALDGAGPTATAANIGPKHSTCTMKLGMPWSAFETECVDILSDDRANTALENKILSAASRAVTPATNTAALDATWVLDVTGVHPNFASVRFSETAPPADAPINQLVLDQHATGKILNDYAADGTTLTFEGSAAIYLQYARYVQAFVQSQLGPGAKYGLGDPQCMTAKPADGCTGIEQMVLPATTPPPNDPNIRRISISDPAAFSALNIGSALRATDLNATFCSDAPTFKHCTPSADGLFEGIRDQLIAVVANGDATRLPEGLKDRKVFVRLWMKALAKYLRVASQHPSDLSDPKYDAATPADTDITVDSIRGSSWSVKYQDKIELQLNYLVGTGNSMTFR